MADDENLAIAAEHGFVALEQSNDEIGRKFNDGIEYALHAGADHVVLIGSDDWVHASVFDRLPRQQADLPLPTPQQPVVVGRSGPEAMTGSQIALVDLEGGRMRAGRAHGRHGTIPWVLPRSALEPSDGRPIRETQQRGIDGALLRGLGVRPRWFFHDPHPFARVDFKSGINMNTYESRSRSIGEGDEMDDPWTVLREHYDADLVELARETADSMVAV